MNLSFFLMEKTIHAIPFHIFQYLNAAYFYSLEWTESERPDFWRDVCFHGKSLLYRKRDRKEWNMLNLWSVQFAAQLMMGIVTLVFQFITLLGRFLHGNVTLSALCLPLGRTCVMHLVQRENLPDSGNSQDSRLKSKERSTGCCASASCSVL